MMEDEEPSEYSRICKAAGELQTLLKAQAAPLGYACDWQIAYIGTPRWILMSFYPADSPLRNQAPIAHPDIIDTLVNEVAPGKDFPYEYQGFKVEVVHAEAEMFKSLGYTIS